MGQPWKVLPPSAFLLPFVSFVTYCPILCVSSEALLLGVQVRMFLLVMRPVVEAPGGGELDGVHEFDVGTLVDFVRVASLVIRDEESDRAAGFRR